MRTVVGIAVGALIAAAVLVVAVTATDGDLSKLNARGLLPKKERN